MTKSKKYVTLEQYLSGPLTGPLGTHGPPGGPMGWHAGVWTRRERVFYNYPPDLRIRILFLSRETVIMSWGSLGPGVP